MPKRTAQTSHESRREKIEQALTVVFADNRLLDNISEEAWSKLISTLVKQIERQLFNTVTVDPARPQSEHCDI